MDFETAKYIISIGHYVVCIGIGLWASFYKASSIPSAILRFYGVILFWALLCLLFDGCPITHIENIWAYYHYSRPFYPEYSFDQSNISQILKWPNFYIPLGVLLLYKSVQLFNSKNL